MYSAERALLPRRKITISTFCANGRDLVFTEVISVSAAWQVFGKFHNDRSQEPGDPTPPRAGAPSRLTGPSKSQRVRRRNYYFMSYILSDFFPGATEQDYRDEIAAVHPDGALPEGQIHHAAGQSDEGVLIVTIWDSKESADRFLSKVLMPRAATASNGLRGKRQHIGAVGFNP